MPADPGERLHTPEREQRRLTGGDEPLPERPPSGPLARMPRPLPASPRRKDRPTVWRQWSLDHAQQRPRTREVLWPADGRPYKKAPRSRRPHTRQFVGEFGEEDEARVSEWSTYRDAYLGFQSTDQGLNLLAHSDARRLNTLQDEAERRERMLAARHAEKASQFVTPAAKAAVAQPENFALRMVRMNQQRKTQHGEDRVARRKRKAEREKKLARQEAVKRYEVQRKQAIQTTMSLPNLGRPYAAWRRFMRHLRHRAQTAALLELRQRTDSLLKAPEEEWRQQMEQGRRTVQTPLGEDSRPTLIDAVSVDALQFANRPATPDAPLPKLPDGSGKAAALSDEPDEPLKVESEWQARRAVYDAYSATTYYGGERKPLVHGEKPADRARHGFAEACRQAHIPPLPVMPAPYLFGPAEAGVVDVHDKLLGNQMTVALAKGLTQLAGECRVKEVNLSGNGLGAPSMPAIQEFFTARHVVKTLVKIDLSNNPIGERSVENPHEGQAEGCRLLAEAIAGNAYVQELILSDCKMNDKGALFLMPSIGECAALKVLNISHNGLTARGAVDIAEMLDQTLGLEDLDVSWNKLGPKGSKMLIHALENCETLLKLNMEWNSACDAVMELEEVLQDGVLQEIDLSNNEIGEKEAQVIAGLLKKSKTLKKVDLGFNPIGARGACSLFKALLVLEEHGVEVDLHGCNLGSEDASLKLFDPANPNGDYVLDLAVPYDEMVAHELVELAWLEEGENWQDEKFGKDVDSLKPYELKEPEDLGIEFGRTDRLVDHFELPEEGILSLKYASTRRTPKMEDAATDKQIETFIGLMKESAMAAELALKAACSICYLTTTQAKTLVKEINLHAGDRVDAVIFMLPRIIDVAKIPKLLNVLSDEELRNLQGRVGADFFHFNAKNPTGRYKLELSDEFDWMVAQALVNFTNDEILWRTEHEQPDVSQDGGFCGCWRNCLYQEPPSTRKNAEGEFARVHPFAEPFIYSLEWMLPGMEEDFPKKLDEDGRMVIDEEKEAELRATGWRPGGGILQLDFSSTNQPSSHAEPVSATVLENLLGDMAAAFNRVHVKAKPKYRSSKAKKKKEAEEVLPATALAAVPDASKTEIKAVKKRFRRLSACLPSFGPGLEAAGDGGDKDGGKPAEAGQSEDKQPAELEEDDSSEEDEIPAASPDTGPMVARLEIEPASPPPSDSSPPTDPEEAPSVAASKAASLFALPAAAADGDDEEGEKGKWKQAAGSIKAARNENLMSGGADNRGTMMLDDEDDGGSRYERPPWAVPLRDKYVVPSESERRRLASSLASQVLRRSTFLCYFSCDQVLRIVGWFPREHRVEACVILYARCIDFERFVAVKSLLTANEIADVTQRLGALSLMNPYNPDGPYILDLAKYDERKVALMLIWLADGEPGENWQDESLDDRDLDITKNWLTDEGLPPKGIMKLRYVTNPCCAVPELRSKLAENTLIGGGKTDLIPQDRVRPPTPEHLKSRFTGDEEEEKVFAGVRHPSLCCVLAISLTVPLMSSLPLLGLCQLALGRTMLATTSSRAELSCCDFQVSPSHGRMRSMRGGGAKGTSSYSGSDAAGYSL